MKEYITVSSASCAELIINRSKFIGRCFPFTSEEAALAELERIRKQHWDATHNCFAYRIGPACAPARFSDDGEPGGTAGRPIMDVLSAKGVTDVLLVVTRYFGGILLGAGGLVRAYSRAAADAVAEAGLVAMRPAMQVLLTLDYSRYNALLPFLEQALYGMRAEFTDAVAVRGTLACTELPGFTMELTARTDGKVAVTPDGESYLAVKLDGISGK